LKPENKNKSSTLERMNELKKMRDAEYEKKKANIMKEL